MDTCRRRTLTIKEKLICIVAYLPDKSWKFWVISTMGETPIMTI